MAQRLWDKGESVNQVIFDFTVGTDPEIDLELLPFDCIGSAAHAKMLAKIKLLTDDESGALLKELESIYQRGLRREFKIARELEDCHTAIESELTSKLGEIGQKIHTGRSRNDQVLLCMRLLLRERTTFLLTEVEQLLTSLEKLYSRSSKLQIPGYTHLMPAMPSSVGMWIHAQYEALLESATDGLNLLESMNSNPLGAASGFDVPLPLDRKYVAEQLGFDRVQRSVIDVQNSRGRYERKLLNFCSEIGCILEKCAWDLQLFFMKEFGFVSLPAALTTGSSIMPQKRNPDVLELMRASVGKIRGALNELSWITAKLPSNYHRDFQLTKEPTIRGLDATAQLLKVAPIVFDNVTFNAEAINSSMHPELYATYGVYARVRKGMPFRQAYQEAAKGIANGADEFTPYIGDFKDIAEKSELGWKEAMNEKQAIAKKIAGWQARVSAVGERVFTTRNLS